MKEIVGGVTKEYNYIGGDAYSAPVVLVIQSGSLTYYYLLRDYLGNITHVYNASTSTAQEYSFDAWGRRRNPVTWSYDLTGQPELFADRGFTSHEYLKYFNLYNMNGRMYDPLVGRFLNVDPYVQMPDYSQNFNRYSYCINNPLKYNDKNGEFFLGTILTFVGDLFKTAFLDGGLDPTSKNARNSAWRDFDPTAQWSPTNKAWKIDIGGFKTDPNRNFWGRSWQLISRWTREFPQTVIGNGYTHLRNLSGKVDEVQYFGGVTFAIDENVRKYNGWRGVSLGNYINAKIPGELNKEFPGGWIYSEQGLFWHEYGHTTDSMLFGLSYLLAIGIPSGTGAEWTEKRANNWAWKYAKKHKLMDEWMYPFTFPLN